MMVRAGSRVIQDYMLTVDNTKCGSADTVKYPLLFCGQLTTMKSIANGGVLNSVNGFAAFTDSGHTTGATFERIYHDLTTGEFLYTITVPTLTVATASVLYLSLDSSRSVDASTGTNPWNAGAGGGSNYQGIYHCAVAGVLNFGDASGNANHGTQTSVTLATGPFDGGTRGGAGSFSNASHSLVDLGAGASLSIAGDAAVEAWVKPSSLSPGAPRWIYGSSDGSGIQLGLEWGRTGNKYDSIWGSSGFDIKNSATDLTTAWQHLVLTRVGGAGASSGIRLYRNGVLDANFPQSGSNAYAGMTRAAIGYYKQSNTDNQQFDGLISEVRISNAVRSASYITATYNNHWSPSTFYTLT